MWCSINGEGTELAIWKWFTPWWDHDVLLSKALS
uniref:Uncharacterized protein n=1 Tax=Anguilla anguilla TaxID=7936 RepID=A0A0E9VFM6_ANGAN